MINTKVINWDVNLSKHLKDMINNLPTDKEVEGLSGKESILANLEAQQADEQEDYEMSFGHDERQDGELAFQ